MRVMLVLLAMVKCSFAHADLYKCVEQGITSYQEKPCGPGKVSVPMESELSKKIKAADSAKVLEILLREKEMEDRQWKYRELMREQQKKAARCEALFQVAMSSKAEASIWENPELRYAAKTRQINAEDAYAKECYTYRR